MASKFLTVFLLLALVVFVNAQNNTATNEIDQCIKRENCAPNDRECRAACAGVPDPDPKVANDTQECYKKCADDHLPDDEDSYKTCIGKCQTEVYQEGVTEPGSPAPSKTAKNDGGSESGSGSGDDKGANGGDDNEADGKDNESDDKDNKTDESGADFSAKSVHVYVIAAVIACAAFTVGL